MHVAENSALRRYANNRVDHFDGLVFWAKEYFDRFDRSTFFRDRFESYHETYEHHMGNFVATLNDRINNRTQSSFQLKSEFKIFFQAIERLVHQMLLIAQIPGIPKPQPLLHLNSKK